MCLYLDLTINCVNFVKFLDFSLSQIPSLWNGDNNRFYSWAWWDNEIMYVKSEHCAWKFLLQRSQPCTTHHAPRTTHHAPRWHVTFDSNYLERSSQTSARTNSRQISKGAETAPKLGTHKCLWSLTASNTCRDGKSKCGPTTSVERSWSPLNNNEHG